MGMLSALLLRRINVGGSHVKMADLCATIGGAGYRDAVSVLASGNVIVQSEGPVDVLAIEDAIDSAREFAKVSNAKLVEYMREHKKGEYQE